MPALVMPLESDRHDGVKARVAAARARVAAAPRAAVTVASARGYATAGQARAAAGKAGGPDVIVAAVPRERGDWIPVVVLRADQLWMDPHVRYCGVLTVTADRVAALPGVSL